MAEETNNRELLKRYLLGDVSQAELEAIEDSFADDHAFEEYLVVEEDLIDAYLREELGERERRQFESSYLGSSRDRHVRLDIAHAVLESIPLFASSASSPPTEVIVGTPTWKEIKGLFFKYRLQYVLGVLVVGFLVVWVVNLQREVRRMSAANAALESRRRELDDEETSFRQRQQQLQKDFNEQRITRDRLTQQLQKESAEHDQRTRQLMKELEQASPNRAQAFEALIFAFPHSTKGSASGPPRIIRAGTKWVAIKLILARNMRYTIYRAELESEAGLIPQDGLRAEMTGQGRAVSLRPIAVEKFPDGNINITLYGLDEGGKYQPVDGYTISIKKE